MSFKPPGDCPNCGEYVEPGASACEGCGSCEDTGWNEDSIYDGLDLPTWEEEPREENANRGFSKAVLTLALLAALVYVFVFR